MFLVILKKIWQTKLRFPIYQKKTQPLISFYKPYKYNPITIIIK